MRSFTDLHAAKGYDKGLRVITALGAAGVSMLVCVKGGARVVMVASLLGLLYMLSACSAPTQEEVEAYRKGREAMERYRNEVYGRLWEKWNHYLAQSPNDRARGSVRVVLYVGTSGKMEYLHVKNNPNTDPVLTKLTVKAIQDTKLPPVPEELIPGVKKFHDSRLEVPITFDTSRPEKGGVSASEGPPLNAETKNLMEKRWGLPPEARESNARKVAQQGETKLPSSSTPKGRKTTVKLTSTPLERYYRRVTQAVEKKWHFYLEMQMEGVTYGRVKVDFYVNKKGKVEDPLVVDDKDSYRALTLSTLRAIKDAEIPPMPADLIPLLPVEDRERLKIQYDALIH
jgi:outer membrane biosynthesis protein TonB